MTVIAWDGKTLAADRRADVNGTCSSVTKIIRIESGEILAFTGDHSGGLMLCQWYERGADPAKWPAHQATEHWSRLIVASSRGLCFYEMYPIRSKVLDKFTAFGTGRDIALGAMAMGATAVRAVEIASQFQTQCSNGCDWYDVNE